MQSNKIVVLKYVLTIITMLALFGVGFATVTNSIQSFRPAVATQAQSTDEQSASSPESGELNNTMSTTSQEDVNNVATGESSDNTADAGSDGDVAEGKGTNLYMTIYDANGGLSSIKFSYEYRYQVILGIATYKTYAVTTVSSFSHTTGSYDGDYINEIRVYSITPKSGYAVNYTVKAYNSNSESSAGSFNISGVNDDTSAYKSVDVENGAHVYLWVYTTPRNTAVEFDPNGVVP